MSETVHITRAKLEESLSRIETKLQALLEAVEHNQKERQDLENKIEDAQARIQQILNKLPPQGDVRQMDLLSAKEAE